MVNVNNVVMNENTDTVETEDIIISYDEISNLLNTLNELLLNRNISEDTKIIVQEKLLIVLDYIQ